MSIGEPPVQADDVMPLHEDADIQRLIASFRWMKITDLPEFKPRPSGARHPPALRLSQVPTYSTDRILDPQGAVTDDFLYKGLGAKRSEPEMWLIMARSQPSERKAPIDEATNARLDSDEEANEHGEFHDANDYPDERDDSGDEPYRPFLFAPSLETAEGEEEEGDAEEDEVSVPMEGGAEGPEQRPDEELLPGDDLFDF
jgi:hypothetical protein